MGLKWLLRTILACIIANSLIIQISAEKSRVNESTIHNIHKEAHSNGGNKAKSTTIHIPTKLPLSSEYTKEKQEPSALPMTVVYTTKQPKHTEKKGVSKALTLPSTTLLTEVLNKSVTTDIVKSSIPVATTKPFTKPSTPALTSAAPMRTKEIITTMPRKTCKKGLSCPISQICIDRFSESICICSASKTKKGDKCLDTPTAITFALKLLAEFKGELEDTSSREFILLAEKIEKAIDPLMNKVKGYKSVQVQSFISGSTVANVIVKYGKEMESKNAVSATHNIVSKAIKSGDLDSLGVDKTSTIIVVPYSDNANGGTTKIPLTKAPGEESNKTVVIVVVILLIIFVIVVIIVVLYCRKKTKGVTKIPTDDEELPLEEA
jgi:hypothetical protein